MPGPEARADAATETVRRCERRVGQLVRQGQAEGTIRKRGQSFPNGFHQGSHQDERPTRIRDIMPDYEWTGGGNQPGIKDLAVAGSELFDATIEEARTEGTDESVEASGFEWHPGRTQPAMASRGSRVIWR